MLLRRKVYVLEGFFLVNMEFKWFIFYNMNSFENERGILGLNRL